MTIGIFYNLYFNVFFRFGFFSVFLNLLRYLRHFARVCEVWFRFSFELLNVYVILIR